MSDVTLSLVSHTNVGKTTLARTLLRRDIGVVLDAPHVTEVSEAHELIALEGTRLLLWDTPGFGDTARLVQRLRREGSPLGWFLHQVWDRARDRPLWCSQQAARNVREDADLVLYLVNAAEDPRAAGYVELELEILAWIGKPVLVLLNQTGPEGARDAELVGRWREALEGTPIVREVLALDAFSRCWVQEGFLLERAARHLDAAKAAELRRLSEAWNARNLGVFAATAAAMARFLGQAAADREPLPGERASQAQKTASMSELARRLESAERELWDEAIAAHGLEGRAAVELARALEHVSVEGQSSARPGRDALIGGAISGALGGLAADLAAGGLTFGGGLVLGALLGALGGAGLGQGFDLVRGRGAPQVRWNDEFRSRLLRRTLLRYLTLAHFGRGRGPFAEGQPDARWSAAVERIAARGVTLDRDGVRNALRALLTEAYPESRSLFAGTKP
ncbi:MAG TPA: DUF3482 domain-containing protein [Planctomycetota bacterium]|nr:DUF3482 domain-containing protein [Planctomycetota bacterium]